MSESSDAKVLSTEEVDAILKTPVEKNSSASFVENAAESNEQDTGNHELDNVIELARVETEKVFTSFFRKKISIKSQPLNSGCVEEFSHKKSDQNIYSVFKIMPHDRYGMIVIGTVFLNQAVSVLYGGQPSAEESTMDSPGKIGMIIAEKISQTALEGFVHACQEYQAIDCQVIKTMISPNLTSKVNMDDMVYAVAWSIYFGDVETTLTLLIPEDLLREFIPIKTKESRRYDSNFWRSAIETQVVDSYVTLTVSLPEIKMKVKDVMALKEGDTIPIGDPTLVYVCLNNIKLFSAYGGQAKSNRVAKIIVEI